MIVLLFMWLLAAIQPSAGDFAECSADRGWHPCGHSGTCIKRYDDVKTWPDARNLCRAEGGDLVKVINREMNDHLKDLIEYFHGDFWIGMSDRFHPGTLRWLDETDNATYYGEWFPPPSSENLGHRCVSLNTHSGEGVWRAQLCSITHKYLCEKSPYGHLTSETALPNYVVKCPSGWTDSWSTKTCVRWTKDEPKSWDDAMAACKEDKGNLVAINDNPRMTKLLTYQLDIDGGWYWVSYRFGTRSPNATDCDAMGVKPGRDVVWSEQPCTEKHTYVCERLPLQFYISNAINGECVYGWRQIPFTGKCIMIHEELKNWHDARQTCKSDGGDMLTVFDHNTNQFIWNQLHLGVYQPFWLGVSDVTVDGKFHWLDQADELPYWNWAQVTKNSPGEDCGIINDMSLSDAAWGLNHCNNKLKFVCEINAGPRPCTEATPGKFGENCKFDCHCFKNEDCDKFSGFCVSGCAVGWFGTGCQYKNVNFIVSIHTYNGAPQIRALMDSKDTTCVLTPRKLFIKLYPAKKITWIRLIYGTDKPLQKIRFTYTAWTKRRFQSMPCLRSNFSKNILDLVCTFTRRVRVVTLYPEAVNGLCTILVTDSISKCPEGRFGLLCEYDCNCAPNTGCFQHNGACPWGCALGFTGETCHTPIERFEIDNPSNLISNTTSATVTAQGVPIIVDIISNLTSGTKIGGGRGHGGLIPPYQGLLGGGGHGGLIPPNQGLLGGGGHGGLIPPNQGLLGGGGHGGLIPPNQGLLGGGGHGGLIPPNQGIEGGRGHGGLIPPNQGIGGGGGYGGMIPPNRGSGGGGQGSSPKGPAYVIRESGHGRRLKGPLVVRCNADLVGLNSSITSIQYLTISIAFAGRPGVKTIAVYDRYSEGTFNNPFLRDWDFEFSGSQSENPRNMNIKWTIHDPHFDDMGIYMCTVDYSQRDRIEDHERILTGQQLLTARGAQEANGQQERA